MNKSTFKIKVTWVPLQRTDTVGPLGPRMANLNNHSLPISLSISQAELFTVIPEKEFDPAATKLLYEYKQKLIHSSQCISRASVTVISLQQQQAIPYYSRCHSAKTTVSTSP